MAFNADKFDIIKQEHDKTGIFFYRETGTPIATIAASGYFNSMASILGTGSVIIIVASDSTSIFKATNTSNVITLTQITTATSSTTSSVNELNILTGATLSTAELNTLTGILATSSEINAACKTSSFIQALTSSGAVTAGKKMVTLNHTSVAIAATIANAALHQNGLLVKAITEPGAGADHTVTITNGTWNGTNKIATFADINDAIYVIFDASGNGTVVSNVGAVVFSG